MSRMHCKAITSAFVVISCFFASTSLAETSLHVRLGDSIRPVTHVATGSLYGLTETYPVDIARDVEPLKPNAFLAPARSGQGRQQPIGGAFLVSPRIENTTAKIHIRLADILPGWPYNFKDMNHWLSEVESVIEDRKAAKVQNFDGYEIWNEPGGTWTSTTIDFNSGLWKRTYDFIRQKDPEARIIGPSYAWYNSSRMEAFIKYCSENDCLPDVISWHQWGSEGFVGAIEHYRSLEKKYNVTPRAVSINEYSSGTHTLEGCPGVSVPFIAKFERHGVESAMISWWFTNLPGRLGSLLTAKNERGGGWYLYKWYGDMSGYMAKVIPPNDKSDSVDGFAAVDLQRKEASIVVGGNTLGEVPVKIDNIPEVFGNKVNVDVEYVVWVDKDSAVASTILESSQEYEVFNSSITIPIHIQNVYYAYRIYITPSIPQAPFGEEAKSIPGKIESENYDLGGEGKSYHDMDVENRGGKYREDGVDIVETGDGYALGYTVADEWTEYTIHVDSNGVYNVDARVATAMDTAGFELYIDEKRILDPIFVAKVDSTFDTYKEIALGSVELDRGEHVLKLKIVKSYINIDWIQFRLAGNEEHTSIKTPSMQFQKAISAEYRVFDFQGNWLGTISGKSREELQFKIGNLVNRNGVFLLKPLKSGKGFRIQVLDK